MADSSFGLKVLSNNSTKSLELINMQQSRKKDIIFLPTKSPTQTLPELSTPMKFSQQSDQSEDPSAGPIRKETLSETQEQWTPSIPTPELSVKQLRRPMRKTEKKDKPSSKKKEDSRQIRKKSSNKEESTQESGSET